MPWVFDPHSGGVKIPKAVQERTRQRILDYAEKHYKGKYTSLDIRFRGALCYIDAYTEPFASESWKPTKDWPETREQMIERRRRVPLHLVRLRYFQENRWSLAFFTYSDEKYTPSVFHTGDVHGTPEEAFEIGAVYLQD